MTLIQVCASLYGIMIIVMMHIIAIAIWSDIKSDFQDQPESLLGVFGSIGVIAILWPISGAYFLYVWVSTRNKEE